MLVQDLSHTDTSVCVCSGELEELKEALLRDSKNVPPFQGKRVIALEIRGGQIFSQEYRVEQIGSGEEFLVLPRPNHTAATPVFMKGKDGKFHPVKEVPK